MKISYKIITDSSCDLPAGLAEELGLEVLPLSVNFRGKTYANYLDGRELDVQAFYNGLREGEVATTTAVNPESWAEAIRPSLEAGRDVLVLAFSSGLSTTCNSAMMAAAELREAYPQRKILVVDTLCASMGQGLLVYLTCKRAEEGASIEEAAAFAEENKLHLCHWFTVDDLMFLKRGGRISAATAVMGTMLKIKPVLHVDDEGHLINMSKARGRKASIDALVVKMAETALNPADQVIFISHGDCPEDAKYLEQQVREKFHPKDVVTSYVGPVIGSHSGPGTLALFFLGQKR